MKKCENCEYGSFGLNCATGEETLYCIESEIEVVVSPDDCCENHKYIHGYCDDEVLGYDCDEEEITEFRVLRFPFSAEIEDWNEEPNIDPRFYTIVLGSDGKPYGISVYDDYNREFIKKYEGLNKEEEVEPILKTVSELSYYEVAYWGHDEEQKPWYYDRDKNKLKQELEEMLKNHKSLTRARKK